MNKPTVTERFRYWFDRWMSKGTIALMSLLGAATVLLVAVVGGVTWLVVALLPDKYNAFDEDFTPWDIFWGGLMRTLDPGTMGGDRGWLFRLLMLVVTIGGLIIVASLIGIISGAFDSKVAELRKGRSKVLEKEHTLILGFSRKVFAIVSEICIANESRGRSVIVILADKDKVEMEDEVRAQVGNTGKTRVICRTGDPMNPIDLEIGNPHTARSIILLAPDDSLGPDSDVIKTALALTNNPRRKAGKYHIVGELDDPVNLEAAALVGRGEAQWVLGRQLIARITVQSCRQSGLSLVYRELLDFDGDEIYFSDQPSLYGSSFSDTQRAFDDSTVIGLVKAGVVQLNCTDTATYEPGDLLVVIAEDDSTVRVTTPGGADASLVSDSELRAPAPERTLVLGFHAGLFGMLAGLNEYVAPGSTVTVLADVKDPHFPQYGNLSVDFRRGDSASRVLLDEIAVHEFDHVIVLAYKETLDTQRADGKTLITLLQLRDIEERTGAGMNIVSEMLDDRNRELAEVTNADDFIVSDKLISLMLAQASESQKLRDVFEQLFGRDGPEIYLNPAEQYVVSGQTMDFYTVLEAARLRGETAIGYRIHADAHNSSRGYGVVVNPKKSARVSFSAGDRIIVVGEA